MRPTTAIPGFPRLAGRTAVVVGLVVLSACSSHKSSSVAAKGAAHNATTSTTAAASSGSGVSAAGGPASTSGGGPATTAKRGGTAATAAPGRATSTTATTAPPPKPGQRGSVGAASGRYKYDVSGYTQNGTPPTTAPLKTTATLTVDPNQGTDQHEQTADEKGQTVSESVFRYLSDGVYIVDLKAAGKEFKPNPPVLGLPKPATPGRSWSWDATSTDGTTTAHADYKINGNESVNVGGKDYPTVVIHGVITFKGTFNGTPYTATLDDTQWLSEQYDLAMKLHDVTDVPNFFHSDTTSQLESITPT